MGAERMNLSAAYRLLKDTFHEWNEDKVPRLGAALACYTVFSLAPLLVLILAVAGLVFGPTAGQRIADTIGATVGKPVGDAVGQMLAESNRPATGGVAAVVGVVALLFGAAGVFGQLQDALNTIWKVEPKPNRGLWGMVRDRFWSLAMVFGVCFLLLVSLVLTAGLEGLSRLWAPAHPQGVALYLTWAVNEAVNLLVLTGLFALTYKYLPDAEVRWADVGLGAFLTAVLFTVGKYLLGVYVAAGNVTTGYGAAGSLVLVIVWVYYSSQIVLFGAELTRVYAQRYGHGVRPAADAVPVNAEAQARQGIARTNSPVA